MIARGFGLGSMLYGIGYGFNRPDMGAAEIEVADDGTATLYCGACEMGQGLMTVIAQIAAESLGMPVEDVRVVVNDTGAGPDSGPTSASRATYVQGNAVIRACADVRPQLAAVAATTLKVPADELVFKDGQIAWEGDRARAVSFKSVAAQCHQKGKRCIGYGFHDITTADVDPETSQGDAYATYAWATQLAEVEVDTETGEVTVVRLVSATDAGKAINPQLVEGQIEGGAVTGIGYALYEDFEVDDRGVPLTSRLSTYMVPTALDVPDIEPLIIEIPEPTGPYGAKGVGEPATIPTAPAILNAIHDAVGIRVTRLPAKPGEVLRLIREKQEREAEKGGAR